MYPEIYGLQPSVNPELYGPSTLAIGSSTGRPVDRSGLERVQILLDSISNRFYADLEHVQTSSTVALSHGLNEHVEHPRTGHPEWKMRATAMPGLRLIRMSIASVWMYQGLWCKLLGHAPRHEAILDNLPLLTTVNAHFLLLALGLLECGIAVWTISGWHPRLSVLLQTGLLVTMNAGALIFAARLVPDPAGMLLQNFAFLLLAWIAAADIQTYESLS